MYKEPSEKKPYHFPGITVLVAKQGENDVIAVDKGSLVPDTIPTITKKFTLIRLIGNFVILTQADYDHGNTMNPLKSFDPPLEIRVGYNFDDAMKCRGGYRKLKLAYWDGSEWVIISDAAHEYQILPPSTGQVAEARIHSWAGDPPLGWGK